MERQSERALSDHCDKREKGKRVSDSVGVDYDHVVWESEMNNLLVVVDNFSGRWVMVIVPRCFEHAQTIVVTASHAVGQCPGIKSSLRGGC